jgi:hypothetical protein
VADQDDGPLDGLQDAGDELSITCDAAERIRRGDCRVALVFQRPITLFQLADSAKAPCTKTTVGWDPSCGFVLIVLPPRVSLS